MKILLASLMCLVLGASECFAISGGPVFDSGVNVVGTYAGVIKARRPNAPPSDKFPEDFPPGCSLNSLGVFSVGVPTTGIGTGDFVMFSQGQVFTGTIRGTADPNTGKLTGVLDATFDFTIIIPGGDTIDVTAEANGHLKTTISNISSQGVTTGIRLAGTATLNINQGAVDLGTLQPIPTCEMTLRVKGFKQSTTVSTSTGTSG
jgi:hypothetical protein